MNYRLVILGLATLVLLVAACAPLPPLRDENLLHDSSILLAASPADAGDDQADSSADAESGEDESNDCVGPPCWLGIRPGTTSWSDALTIIEDRSDMVGVETQEADDSDLIGAIWKFEDESAPQCCQMIAENGDVINLIFLRTAPDHTVGELVEVHGEPDYVIGTPYSDDQAIINLVYPEIPMIIFAFVAGAAEGELSEDSEIIGSLYTTPENMELFLVTNNLHLWEGYQTYTAYDEGDFEITPSVTITPTASESE